VPGFVMTPQAIGKPEDAVTDVWKGASKIVIVVLRTPLKVVVIWSMITWADTVGAAAYVPSPGWSTLITQVPRAKKLTRFPLTEQALTGFATTEKVKGNPEDAWVITVTVAGAEIDAGRFSASIVWAVEPTARAGTAAEARANQRVRAAKTERPMIETLSLRCHLLSTARLWKLVLLG
jgi:hypothetical protein